VSGAEPITRLVPVTIPGPVGAIEGLLQVREPDEHRLTALVCHPHPLYGGTLHNKVVHRVAGVLADRGAAVLRFNFRGAGKSEGVHDQGAGELDDARAALDWLAKRWPRAHRWAAGFSFGSWIAARLAAGTPAIEHLTLVAPPVTRSGFSLLRTAAVPKLVIQGTADTTCPPEALRREFVQWAEPKRLIEVEGATHFFDRKLADLAQALEEGLPPAPAEATSSVT
jgi:uncharacterized protein